MNALTGFSLCRQPLPRFQSSTAAVTRSPS